MKNADIILSSNTVFTGHEDFPKPASIAIYGNKILAIGTDEVIQNYVGQNTIKYHFKDKLIMPGFHDSHVHTMLGGLSIDSINLLDTKSEHDAVNKVYEFSRLRPDEDWIIGFQWESNLWEGKQHPTSQSLDKLIPDRPVMLLHLEGHHVWVNSKALEIAQINSDTINPPYGSIEKDEFGNPTGILSERAVELITDKAFNFTKGKRGKMLKEFLSTAAELGVTSVNDLFGESMFRKLDDYDLFKEFEELGQLTTRIHLYPDLGSIENAKKLHFLYKSDKLRVSGLKQFVDGVTSQYTAALLQPYSDNLETSGNMTLPAEELNKWVTQADKEGFNIRLHAIGDRAVRKALDAYEIAKRKNNRDSRHAVEHVELIHPDDIERFKQLGVIASMQPNHFGLSERDLFTSRLGNVRTRYFFPFNSLKRAEAYLSFGTDFPIDSLNPLSQIYRAITRIDSTGKDIWNSAECIGLTEALRAYTYTPAYGNNRDNELGTLDEGKLADIIVLDRNIYEIPNEEINEAKVELTMFDGKVIYKR